MHRRARMRHTLGGRRGLEVIGRNLTEPQAVTIMNASVWGCGAVGARFLGMEEVAGSNPASSTNGNHVTVFTAVEHACRRAQSVREAAA